MDEIHCRAYPEASDSDSAPESPVLPNDQQLFNVEFEYSNMYVLNASKFDTFSSIALFKFLNIPKDEIMQETTIVTWLSEMRVPGNAHSVVVAKVLQCARDMVGVTTDTPTQILSMRVEVLITRANEDGIGDSDNDNDDSYEEDDQDGIDEEEEEEEEDYGFVPAAKTVVEGLEMVEQKGSERCAICFEDFLVGVRMPCLHMFHKNCVSEWLQISNSCPLCRFKMPSKSD